MSTATVDKNTAERAVYDSLPTAAEGWATPKAVAEVTELAVSTVRKQLNRLAESGRVESSSDPEVTGAKGTLWRQAAESASAERVAEAFEDVEAEMPADVPPGISAADLPAFQEIEREATGEPEPAADEPEPATVDDTSGEPETAASDPPATPEPPSWLWPQAVADEDRLDQAEARELTDRIKTSVRELLPMIIEAYRRRAHLALGYPSWTEYCDAELVGLRMPIGDRQSAARALRQVGMSTRAIAGALGTSDATVRRDLGDARASDDAPAVSVRGLDGKEYAAKPKAKREPAPPRDVPVRVVEPAPPVVPTETGTCAHCEWAIGRRLDVEGAQWKHNASGQVECGKGHPGLSAEPIVVIEGEAVDHGTVEAETVEPASNVDLGDDPDGDIEGSDQGFTRTETPTPSAADLAALNNLLRAAQALSESTYPEPVAAAVAALSAAKRRRLLDQIDATARWLRDVAALVREAEARS